MAYLLRVKHNPKGVVFHEFWNVTLVLLRVALLPVSRLAKNSKHTQLLKELCVFLAKRCALVAFWVLHCHFLKEIENLFRRRQLNLGKAWKIGSKYFRNTYAPSGKEVQNVTKN